MSLIIKYTPTKRINCTHRVASLPANIMRLINLKQSAWRQYKKHKSISNKKIFYRLAKTVKNSIFAYRKVKEENILLSGSIKKFYNYARSRMGPLTSIGPIKDTNGLLVENDLDKAELFNDFFHSVYISDDDNAPPFENRTNVIMPTPTFTRADVKRALSESKNSSSCGPDGCPPLLLKKFPELCEPLCDIFNMSLVQGYVPAAWKVAHVTPIYKGKGSVLDITNYRPISLTNVFCKTLERLIRGKIMSHLESNNLLSTAQSGFRTKHSALTQLTNAQAFISNNLNKLNCVDGVYTDLSKAFDTISHKKLILKLQAYGIQGPLLNWIKSFLTDRKQSVHINSALSSFKTCISGVPQGSVLSPIIFILYINDLPDCIKHSQIFLYADDAKLLKSITCRLDCILLEQDLDAVVAWCLTWQLSLNITKCLYIRFGLANKPQFNYSLSGIVLSHVQSVNDLGIVFDSKCDFSLQCHKMAAKGFARVNVLLRSFYTKDRSLQCKLYTTFVRPILEYNSPIWSPHLNKNILILERVQKYVTKNLKGLSNKTYKERLAILQLHTLECRRNYYDLVFLYKILHGSNDRLKSLFPPSVLNTNMTLRRHSLQLYIPKPRSDIVKFSFCNRVSNLWNSLPAFICNASSISVFKKLLLTHKCTCVFY